MQWNDITKKPPPKNITVLCAGCRDDRDCPSVYLAHWIDIPFEADDGHPLLMRDNDGCGFTITCQPTHWTTWNYPR